MGENAVDGEISKDGATCGDHHVALPVLEALEQQISVVADGSTTELFAKLFADKNKLKEDWDESFHIGDIGRILDQYKRWKRELPCVEVFYAVKANSLRPVIRTMAALGCGFDCESKATYIHRFNAYAASFGNKGVTVRVCENQSEISYLLNCGIRPDKITYSHPCKMISHLTYARDNDVNLITFDNEEELLKIKSHSPTMRLMILVQTNEESTSRPFENNFGASLEYGKLLLRKAKALQLAVVGISFHVGSGCPSPKSFTKAIEDSRKLFDFATEMGFDFKILDIGGGFPEAEGDTGAVSFESVASAIRDGLERHFPDGIGVRIIAKPGRFFCGPAFSVVTNVSAKKVVEDRIYYHIGDGVCNNFVAVFVEGKQMHPSPLESSEGAPLSSTVFGVSCSGADMIAKDVLMKEVQVGDWIIWKDYIGEYLPIARQGFNGYTSYKACYFITRAKLNELRSSAENPSFLPETKEYGF